MNRRKSLRRRIMDSPGQRYNFTGDTYHLLSYRSVDAGLIKTKSVSGRALMSVVIIMTFLACLAVGGAITAGKLGLSWINDISLELTVQILPQKSLDIQADAQKAAGLARRQPGISFARIYSEGESAALIKPWIDSSLIRDVLPIPRIIVLEIDDTTLLDIDDLRRKLQNEVPSAFLDDHNVWVKRLTRGALAIVILAVVIMLLLLLAMGFSVISATRAALSSNKDVVDVLHFVGASDSFIAGQFQRHFLSLGLRGALIGSLIAVIAFMIMNYFRNGLNYSFNHAFNQLMQGDIGIDLPILASIAATILLATLVTTFTSRSTVKRLLRQVRI